MIGGVLSCGLTHLGVVPLDIVKCKAQVFPEKYRGLLPSMRTVVADEGLRGLTIGWAPTFLGYSMQGFCRFGFYEFFKDLYANAVGEENFVRHRGAVWLGAAASAEFIADFALCPWEMTKVKVQTSPAGSFPTSMWPATAAMWNHRAQTRFPFGSLPPLWARQIPYTMAKFYFFEKIVELFYTHLFTKPKNSYSKAVQLEITFSSGFLAGVICAIVSHPADTIVSQMAKTSNQGKTIGTIMREVGFRNLFTRGLGTRILMVGTLASLQWWIYDSWKTSMGFGTTGGAAVKKS